MNQIQEKFHRCFNDRGGLFDYEAVGGNAMLDHVLNTERTVMQAIAKEFTAITLPAIHFINNNAFNASAAKFENDYFIGIYIGVIPLLKDLFNRMMANQAVLPEVGEVKNETNPKIFNAQLSSYDQLLLVQDMSDTPRPRDPLRQLYAEILFDHAFSFLVNHEFAHIIMGHVGYLESLRKEYALTEFTGHKFSVDREALFFQTLEMDADADAANQGLNMLLMMQARAHMHPTQELARHFKDPDLSFLCWSIAIYTVFKLFESGDAENDPYLSKHPPFNVRRQLILSLIIQIYQTRFPQKKWQKMVNLSVQAVAIVEQAFPAISEQPYNPSGVFTAYLPGAQEQLSMILQNWAAVRPLLEPFAMVKLAPIY